MVIVRFHLEDNGFIAAQNQFVANLGSELATILPAGSGSIAQISLDSSGSLTINASNMQAAQLLASLIQQNIVVAQDTGEIDFSSIQGGLTKYSKEAVVAALKAITFPGATLVQDI